MADEVVLTDGTKRLRTSAEQFGLWSKELLADSDALAGLTITPGDFPAGTEFKNLVVNRGQAVRTNTASLARALQVIADALVAAADEYDKMEDDNKNDAERIDPFFDKVNKELQPKGGA